MSIARAHSHIKQSDRPGFLQTVAIRRSNDITYLLFCYRIDLIPDSHPYTVDTGCILRADDSRTVSDEFDLADVVDVFVRKMRFIRCREIFPLFLEGVALHNCGQAQYQQYYYDDCNSDGKPFRYTVGGQDNLLFSFEMCSISFIAFLITFVNILKEVHGHEFIRKEKAQIALGFQGTPAFRNQRTRDRAADFLGRLPSPIGTYGSRIRTMDLLRILPSAWRNRGCALIGRVM